VRGIGVDEVALGESHHAALYAQQAANVEVLAGLRLDRFVRGYDQQNQINPSGTREHVADKFFVAGDIHKAEAHASEIEKSKPQIDCDAAPLLFCQAVRMSACQRFDQSGLAVVDVPGGSDNDALFGRIHKRSSPQLSV